MKKKIFQANIIQHLWTRLQAQKRDNKGSSIVTVIVTMSIVLIMATVVLSTSMMNYYMKTNDKVSTSNFYGAEAALEEIRMGLATEVSRAMSQAYNQVLTEYENNTTNEKKYKFRALFSNYLGKALALKDNKGDLIDKYDTDVLAGYFRKYKFDETNKIGARLITEGNSNTIVLNGDDGVTLRNIDVRYDNEDGYVNEIKTDILLAYPDVSFIPASSTPDLASFCIIAGTGTADTPGVTTGTSTSFVAESTSSIYGNVYLGENNSKLGGNIKFAKNTDDTQPGNYKLITSGDLELANTNTLNISDYDIWGKSINLRGAKFYESGVCTTNLSNDLVLANQGSIATLTGEYYGFGIDEGTGALASDSSAVIINGIDSNLDMSALSKMIVGGLAYVDKDTYFPGTDSVAGADIMTGETVSIRPNQRAYLVPLDLVGKDYTYGGFNPMTEKQYSALVEEITEDLGYYEDYVQTSELVATQGIPFEVGKIDDTIATKSAIEAMITDINKTYNSGVGATTDGPFYIENDSVMAKGLAQIGAAKYKTYHTQGIKDIHKLAYLFMDFDTVEHANGYYNLYSSLSVQRERLEGNMGLYSGSQGIKMPLSGIEAVSGSGITTESSINYYYKGSLLDNSNGVNVYKPDLYTSKDADGSLIKSEPAANDAMSQLIARRTSYNGLTHKLVEDVLSPEELAKTVFENLIDEDAMDGKGIEEDRPLEMAIPNGSMKEFENKEDGPYKGYKCRIVRQDNYSFSDGISGKVSLIISTGNVNITGDYNGLVFAKGKITVDGNRTIKSDAAAVLSVLSAMNDDKVCPGYYLKNYESYISTGSDDEQGVLRELEYVKYANWQKK